MYIGPSTWNKLSNNLKTASSLDCFKHNIKKYFIKKLGEMEVDIYSLLKEKTLELEHNHDNYTFAFISSMFPLYKFLFLRYHFS